MSLWTLIGHGPATRILYAIYFHCCSNNHPAFIEKGPTFSPILYVEIEGKTESVCVALVCPAKRRSHDTPVNRLLLRTDTTKTVCSAKAGHKKAHLISGSLLKLTCWKLLTCRREKPGMLNQPRAGHSRRPVSSYCSSSSSSSGRPRVHHLGLCKYCTGCRQPLSVCGYFMDEM